MAYTNVWSTTRPTGSQPAKLADDEIRALRLDIQERLNTIFVDWSTDPVVMKGDFGGPITGKRLYVHHTEFLNNDGLATTRTNQYTQDNDGPTDWFAPLIIPPAVSVTKLEAIIDPGSNITVTARLAGMTFDTNATVSTLFSCSATGLGIVIASSAEAAQVLDSNSLHFLWITTPAGTGQAPRFYGVRVTYDVSKGSLTI